MGYKNNEFPISKIQLTDLYEILCVLYNKDKCHRIIETPEELMEVIQKRCAAVIHVERNGQGQVFHIKSAKKKHLSDFFQNIFSNLI
jgi:hypothetical protein